MRLLKDLAGAVVLLFVGGAVLLVCAAWDGVARVFRRRV